MKVTILQENLAHGLSIVSRAVGTRSTLPVLNNILVATNEGGLQLSATDLEIGITCWIGAQIHAAGATTAPARTFCDLVATLPKDRVELTLDDHTHTLKVHGGASKTNLKCLPVDEYPPMIHAENANSVQLNTADLKKIIQQVLFAASKDESRPVLTGVLVNVAGDQITLAAADGFRLSVRRGQLPIPVDNPVQALIPARALNELVRIIDTNDEVKMTLLPETGRVVFRTPEVELSSLLIEGNFPDYQQIIPQSYQTRTTLNTALFLKACQQAEIFAREDSQIARLQIRPQKMGAQNNLPGTVEISGQSEETGSSQAVLEAAIEGPPILIAFNVRFLREALSAIQTPNVLLETNAETDPGVVKPASDTDFTHILMPMHLGG
jgi:DNA polymerase-3 subunit beta